jgi:putative membrane protein
MYYFNGYAPFHAFGFLFMILFWGLVIYGVILLAKHYSEPMKKDRALEILKERYAKGEIKREEFENIKKDIK